MKNDDTPTGYRFVRNALGYVISIQCCRCGLVSYNANDIRERYCGHCHRFHDDEYDNGPLRPR